MSKALAGFGTGSSKPKSGAGPLGAAVVAAAQAQAASEAKQQHQMASIVNNIPPSGRNTYTPTTEITPFVLLRIGWVFLFPALREKEAIHFFLYYPKIQF